MPRTESQAVTYSLTLKEQYACFASRLPNQLNAYKDANSARASICLIAIPPPVLQNRVGA